MLNLSNLRALTRQLDKLVLYAMQRQMPATLEQKPVEAPDLEMALANTQVNRKKTAVFNLDAPGEHTVWLDSMLGELACHVRVRLAVNPTAPLLLYHHGLGEIPFYATWQRLFPKGDAFPAHLVAVQAPYHNEINEALQTGFASIDHIYQMFAGSLRILELMQTTFEAQGAQFSLAGGLSWGGITSILYGGLFQNTRAIIPMYASPNLAQVFWDSAQLFGRELEVTLDELKTYFDFTPYYDQVDPERIFPVLGANDLFFRQEHHADLYPEHALVMTASNHVGAVLQNKQTLRAHIRSALDWAAAHPRMN